MQKHGSELKTSVNHACVALYWKHNHCVSSPLGSSFFRDQDDLVTMEAIKALFGQLPPYNPSLLTGATAQTPQEELVSNRMRIRSWAMVASQVGSMH